MYMKEYLAGKYIYVATCLFILFFGILSFSSALRESLTFDEIVYLQEGRNAVLHRTFDIDPYNPPFARDMTIFPYIFQKQFYQSESFVLQNSLYARGMEIFLGVCLLIGVFIFVQKYFGKKEALFTIFLLSLDPSLLANSHYVTMDITLTLFFFLSYFLFIELLNKPNYKFIFLFALASGLGMATKITFIPYFFLCSVVLLFTKKIRISAIMKYKKNIFLTIFIMCIAIWSAYLFHANVVIKQRQDNTRISVKVMNFASKYHISFLASSLLFLEKQPIPLGDYIATLKNSALRITEKNSCFFLGKYYSSCKWYFLPINFLLKTPIPLFIFVFISLLSFLKRKDKKQIFLYAMSPAISIVLASVFLHLNPLARYVLPAIPFIAIFASISISFWLKTFVRKTFFVILLFWYVAGTFSAFPHFISFANEFTFGQKQFLLTDSNMDWGQSLPDVSQFVKSYTNSIEFSYFGRDNADWYGLQSNKLYGSYKLPDICEFHVVNKGIKPPMILISVSNWYACGYNTQQQYARQKIKEIIGDSILVF